MHETEINSQCFSVDLWLDDFVGRQRYVNCSPHSHQPFHMRVLFYASL